MSENEMMYKEILLTFAERDTVDGLLMLSGKVAHDYTMRDYGSKANTMLLESVMDNLKVSADERLQKAIAHIRKQLMGFGTIKPYSTSHHARAYRECVADGLIGNVGVLKDIQRHPNLYYTDFEFVDELVFVLENKL